MPKTISYSTLVFNAQAANELAPPSSVRKLKFVLCFTLATQASNPPGPGQVGIQADSKPGQKKAFAAGLVISS